MIACAMRGGGFAIQKLNREPAETRKGWPLLTVETEANGEPSSGDYKWKGSSFLGWFAGLVVPVQKIFVLLWVIIEVEGPLS